MKSLEEFAKDKKEEETRSVKLALTTIMAVISTATIIVAPVMISAVVVLVLLVGYNLLLKYWDEDINIEDYLEDYDYYVKENQEKFDKINELKQKYIK